MGKARRSSKMAKATTHFRKLHVRFVSRRGSSQVCRRGLVGDAINAAAYLSDIDQAARSDGRNYCCATVGGWQMDIDHLDGGELFERAARVQPGRQRMYASRSTH